MSIAERHPQAAVIHAWAEGARVECARIGKEEWFEVTFQPLWHHGPQTYKYRIKREPDSQVDDLCGFPLGAA